MATWQLSWNAKNYNASGRMLAAAASESGKNMIQSWGRTSTRNIDKIKVGDTMYISCQKKWNEISNRGMKFVQKKHNALDVANKMEELYNKVIVNNLNN